MLARLFAGFPFWYKLKPKACSRSECLDQSVRINGRVVAVLWRYGFAVLLVAGALGMTVLIQRAIQIRIPFLFFAAVLIAGWYGGRGPAWVAAGLSILAVDYYLAFPFHSLEFATTEETFFVPFVICIVIAAWCSSLRSRFEASMAKDDDSEGIPAEKSRNKES